MYVCMYVCVLTIDKEFDRLKEKSKDYYMLIKRIIA